MSSASGRLFIRLNKYANPENKISGGSCCDNVWPWSCSDICDPYFIFKFKGKDKKFILGDDIASKTFSSNDVVRFDFERWVVRFYFFIIFRGFGRTG